MKSSLGILFSFIITIAHAQQLQLNGKLQTAKGELIPYASLSIVDLHAYIIAYTSSNSQGEFSIILPDTADITNKFIEVNHLGYKKVHYPLDVHKTYYAIIMEERKIDLEEVEVKSPPKISSRNDTLRYNVESFTKAEDRTIGDVLKRMPGVEVEESGQIKYNGQNISNFYIDGDDLLNDRYNIGTKSIPHDMVQDIEVLQNHQPIEVLRNKSQSDDVAINLKIKEAAKLKLNGQAKIGGGIPSLYDAELNSILFNQKHKMLNVAKANNTGVDLVKDFKAFQAENMLQRMGNSRPEALLSAGTVSDPQLPKERYYFNNSASLNANNLTSLKSGLQLKSNIGLLIDHNQLNYNSRSDVYLTNDTIRYSEMQAINNKPFMANIALNLRANKSNYYFNNDLKFDFNCEKSNSSLIGNTTDLQQALKTTQYDFSNTLTYIPALRNKNILHINAYLNYYNQPQLLNIEPGINEDVLNDSIPFQAIDQMAKTPSWFSNMAVSYRITKGKIKQNYTVGLKNERQHLTSALLLTQETGQQIPFKDSNNNDLFWNRNYGYVSPSYEYEQGPWENILTLPIGIQDIAYHDNGFLLDEHDKRLLFTPSWRLKYATNQEDYLSFNYTFNHLTGTIDAIYRGVILTNYRNLQNNNATLQAKNIHDIGLRYNFQRNIQMLFMNAEINYSRTKANTINYLAITDNLSQLVQLPYPNTTSTWQANAGISKYLFALNLNINFNASWSSTRSNQFLNNQLLPFNHVYLILSPSFETRLFDQVSFKYVGKTTWTISKLIADERNNPFPDRQMQLYDHNLALSYASFENIFMKLSGRQLITYQENAEPINYFFADLSLRYSINKWKADIQLDITNLTNIKYYETYNLLANQLSYNQYELRGRMIEMKLTINL